MGLSARRSLAICSPLSDEVSPGEGQCQKANQPLNTVGLGQVGLFEPVSPRCEGCKQGQNLPALLVERRGLARVNSPSGQNEKLILST